MNPVSSEVVRFYQTGDASVLKYEQLPLTLPGDEEIRIKVEAIGLNRAEVMFRQGAYLETPQFPSRIGYEAAGIIDAVGNRATTFVVGDRVSTIPSFSMGRYGVYAKSAIVPVTSAAKYPAQFNSEQGTAIWMQYITAYGAMVNIGRLQPGQRVLITAASSSVGVAAIHIAKSLGATVIATTRNDGKKQFLLDQGADVVINPELQDLVSVSRDISDAKGIELIFDPIGGPILSQLAEIAAKGGRIIEYGALHIEATPYPLFSALAKGLIIQGYTIFELTQDNKKLQVAKKFILDLFKSTNIVPVIDRVFSFDQIQQAHEYMESNQQMGKIVIKV